jgi:serine phosphatase RsbU (regulator of sigma subunit)
MNRLLLFILSFCFSIFSFSQIDSLLKKTQETSFKKEIIKQALDLSYNDIVNNLNKCLIIFETIHQQEEKLKNNNVDFAKIKEKLSLIYYLKGNHEKSSKLHQEAITIFEKNSELVLKAKAMAEMAYQGKRRNLKASLRMMKDAINLMIEAKNSRDIAALYDNFGVLHELNQQLDSAEFYYEKALLLKRSFNDSTGIPYSLNNIAGIYFLKNNTDKALALINESNLIRQKLNDYIGISWNEFALGEYFYSKNKFKEAIFHFQKAYQIAISTNYLDLQSRALKYLSSIYANQRNYDSAYFLFDKFYLIHDSLFNLQNQKQILELETVYETEKKVSQIKLLDSDNKLKKQEIIRKSNAQKFLLIIIFLVIIFLVFVVRAYFQKIKTNKIITLQKQEVENQKSEIEKQKHLVVEKQKELMDSINYAKKIQDTILANKIFLKRYLPDHFVFFQPKDIVSGDFYWATKRNTRFYLAVCDSTGHGVPGAFMSIVNIGFLNEAINEKNIELPNEILNYVRSRLENTISKEGQKDGFDGILICMDLNTKEITYSAANNAPVIIVNKQYFEMPKDRMPVGKGEKNQSFSLFNIKDELLKHNINDLSSFNMLLYTDGFADQFGGPKEKKYKYKPLNEFLSKNSNLELNLQHDLIYKELNDWKGNLEQVDDICLVGLKFNLLTS